MKHDPCPQGVHKVTGDTIQKGKRLRGGWREGSKDNRNSILCFTAVPPQRVALNYPSPSFENLFEMHILEPQPRTTESDALWLGPRESAFLTRS